MNDTEQSLPDRLKAWRTNQKWTQEQAARHLGVTLGTFARWETGRFVPRGLYKRLVEDTLNGKGTV